MADDPNTWAPGAPAPWLAGYGPPPLDAALAGGPPPAVVPPPDPNALQPGIGVPAAALAQGIPVATMTEPHVPGDPNAPVPGEIEMPPEYVGSGPNPDVPAPAPLPGPEIQMPPDYVGQGADPAAAQAPPPPLGQFNPAIAGAPGVQPAPFAPPWLQQPQGGAAPAPQADAVSGDAPTGGENPDKALGRVAMDENAPIAQRQLAWQQMSPEQKTELVNNADPKQLAALASTSDTLENLTVINNRHEQARQYDESAQILEKATQRDQAAQQSFMNYQTALRRASADTDAVAVEAQRMSQAKIDPNEHGVGRFIASVFTSALGGAMSQYTGGRNLALEELDKQTQRRIDAQKDNIANGWKGIDVKRNLIAEHLQQSGDMYRAETAYQVSQYDRAISEILTTAQNYDQHGTTNLKSIGLVQQIQAKKQDVLNAFNDKRIQNYKTAADTDLAAANADKSRAETLKIMGKLGGGPGKPVGLSKTPMTHDQLVATLPKGSWIPDMAPGQTMSPADVGQLAEIGGHTLGVNKAATEGAVSAPTADGKNGPLTNPDGIVWHAPEKFHEVVGGMANVNQLADQLARDISQWGGQSDLVKSPHWQQMQSDKEALTFALHKAEGIEGFRPGTADMLEKLTGNIDPTSFMRDATAGIQRAKKNINDAVQAQAHAAGYYGSPIQFVDTSKVMAPGANVTYTDKLNERKIVAAPGKDATPAEKDQGYTTQQEQFAFLQGGALAHGSAEAQDAARATLQQIAEHGGTAEYRDLAKTILEKADPAVPKLSAKELAAKRELEADDRKKAQEKSDEQDAAYRATPAGRRF